MAFMAKSRAGCELLAKLHEPLPEYRIAEAKRWASIAGSKTSDFHKAANPASATEPAYDRDLISEMLSDYAAHRGSGIAYSTAAIQEQFDLLRAADNRDAAGVRTVKREAPLIAPGGSGEAVAETYSVVRRDSGPKSPIQHVRLLRWVPDGTKLYIHPATARAGVDELIKAVKLMKLVQVPHADGGAPMNVVLTSDIDAIRAALALIDANKQESGQ